MSVSASGDEEVAAQTSSPASPAAAVPRRRKYKPNLESSTKRPRTEDSVSVAPSPAVPIVAAGPVSSDPVISAAEPPSAALVKFLLLLVQCPLRLLFLCRASHCCSC